jgi:hypothetical protein
MNISKELAIRILKYLEKHPDFYFPFSVMNKEYADEGEEFVEILTDERAKIEDDDNCKTFQLWENLQNLGYDTTELMAKGFLEKITQD